MVVHPIYAVWCRRSVLDAFEVADATVNGLRTIIDRITAETGIRVSAYLCDHPDDGIDAPIYPAQWWPLSPGHLTRR